MAATRESMDYDVVIVGGGPAGLSTAIRLKQLAIDNDRKLSVCIVEKGAEIGSHILSGAVIETRALDELIPDWTSDPGVGGTEVTGDKFVWLAGPRNAIEVPNIFVPKSMHNRNNRIVSLGRLCRWLGQRAADLDVDIYPGYSAYAPMFDAADRVVGVVTNDVGRTKAGTPKDNYQPGFELNAKYTVFAEGARGHIGKSLIEKYHLAVNRDPQHYAIGLKELWEIDPANHNKGLVVHGTGWPLANNASSGFFAYHSGESQLAIGLIVDLNYKNPWLSPFEEFQRLKHHPFFSKVLAGGQRIAYGARAIAKGGLNSLPKMSMPGAVIVGCNAGTLNFAKIKGTHTAMKSGMVAAETVFGTLMNDSRTSDEADYDQAFSESWAYRELLGARNFGSALHRLGMYAGGALNYLEQSLLGGRSPWTLHDRLADHETLADAATQQEIRYPKPDGVLSFDKLSSVYLSGTIHPDNQPCHLELTDPKLATDINLARYAGPEQRYCPAGVYEFVESNEGPRLQINAQNCVHCKTCDIKDPRQNIAWVPPEAGGPAYSNM
jgi:electron-transferring-flavoprotein dehydrogenase